MIIHCGKVRRPAIRNHCALRRDDRDASFIQATYTRGQLTNLSLLQIGMTRQVELKIFGDALKSTLNLLHHLLALGSTHEPKKSDHEDRMHDEVAQKESPSQG